METTRRVLNLIFYIALTIGLIWFFVMLLGGGFPMNMSNNEATVRFDVARMGWDLLDPANGVMTINHEKGVPKEGWGCLQLDYKPSMRKTPGVFSTCYGFESFLSMNIWMKAKHECIIGLTLKDKMQQFDFTMPFRVTNKWARYDCNPTEFQNRVGFKGRMDYNRFAGYLAIRDITPRPNFSTNTLWVDTIKILR
jgi:hypothetical protein